MSDRKLRKVGTAATSTGWQVKSMGFLHAEMQNVCHPHVVRLLGFHMKPSICDLLTKNDATDASKATFTNAPDKGLKRSATVRAKQPL
jgi:hypothetical protein